MTAGRLPARGERSAMFSAILCEALDKVASPEARNEIVTAALAAVQGAAVPEDPDGLSRFVSGPLCEAASEVLGSEAADALLEDLEPLLRLAAVAARQRVSERPVHPSGTLVPPPPHIASGEVPVALEANAPQRRTTLPYMSGSDGSRKLILVVDDDAPFLNGLTRLLRLAGHDVVTAPHGAAALRLCQRLRPQLVITDLDMPPPNGAELAKQIVARGANETQIILLTGLPDPPKALPGVARVLTKSIRAQELMDVVDALLAAGDRAG